MTGRYADEQNILSFLCLNPAGETSRVFLACFSYATKRATDKARRLSSPFSQVRLEAEIKEGFRVAALYNKKFARMWGQRFLL